MKDLVRYTLIFLISFFFSLIFLNFVFGADTKIYDSTHKQVGTIKEYNGELRVYDSTMKKTNTIKDGKIYDDKNKQIGTIEKQGRK